MAKTTKMTIKYWNSLDEESEKCVQSVLCSNNYTIPALGTLISIHLTQRIKWIRQQ